MWTVQLLRIVFTNTFVFLFLTTSVLFAASNNVGFIDFGSISSTFLHASPPSPPLSSSPPTILDSGHHYSGDDSYSSDTDIVTPEDELINYREQDLDHFFPSEAFSPWLDISPVEIEAGKEDADASQGDVIGRTLMPSENGGENPTVTISSVHPSTTDVASTPPVCLNCSPEAHDDDRLYQSDFQSTSAASHSDVDRSPVKTKAEFNPPTFGDDIYGRPAALDDFKLPGCVALFSLTVLAFLSLHNTYGRRFSPSCYQSFDYFVAQLRVPLLLRRNQFLANGLEKAVANVKKEEWKNNELHKMVEQAYQELVKLDKASADSRTKAELEQALKRSNDEVDESRRDAVRLNTLVDKLRQDLERESTKNTDLEHRLQLSQANLRRLTHSDKEREEEMAAANQDRLNAIAEARHTQDETTALRAEVGSVRLELRELRAEIESARRDLATSRRDAEVAQNEARAIRIENVSLRSALAESREEVSALQKGAEGDVDTLRAGLEEQKAINENLHRILAEYKQGFKFNLTASAPLTPPGTVTSLEDVQKSVTSPYPETTSGLSDEEPTGAEPAQQQDFGSGEGAATPFDFETRDDLAPSQTAVDVAEPRPEPSQTQSATTVDAPTSTSTSAPAPDQAGGLWLPALGFNLGVPRTTSFPKYEPGVFGLSFGHQDNNSDATTKQYKPVQSNSEACGRSSNPIGSSADEGEPVARAQSATAVDAEGSTSTPAPAPDQAGGSWLPAFGFTLNVPRATSFPNCESGLFGLSFVNQCSDSKATTKVVDEAMSDEDAEGEDDSGWDTMEMDEDRSTPANAPNVPSFDAVPAIPPIPAVPSVPIVPSMPMDTSLPLDSSIPSDPDLVSAAIATWQTLFPAVAPSPEGNSAALFDALLGPNNIGTWNEQPAMPVHTGPLPTSSQDSTALSGAPSTVSQQWQQPWLDSAFQPLPDPGFGISSTQQPSFTPNVVPPMGNTAQQPLGDGASASQPGNDSLFDWIFGATTQVHPPDSNAGDPVDTSLLNNFAFIPPESSQWSGTPIISNPPFVPLAQAPPYPFNGPLLDPVMDTFTFGQLLPVGDIAPNPPSALNSTPPSVQTPALQPPTLDAFVAPPPTVFPFIPIGEPLSIDPSLSVDEPVGIPAPVAADDRTLLSYTGPAGDAGNNDDEIWRQICTFADGFRASGPSPELGPRTPVEQDRPKQNSGSGDEEFEDLLAKIATPAAGDVIIPLSPSPTPASEPLTPSPNAQVASRGANVGSAGKVKRGVSSGSRSQNEDVQAEEEDEFPPAVYIPKHDRLIRGMPRRLKKTRIAKGGLSFQRNPVVVEVDSDSGTSAHAWGAGDANQDCPLSYEPPRTETGKRAIRPLPKSRRRVRLPVSAGCVDRKELGRPTEQSEDTWQTSSPLPTSPEMESNLHPSFGECYRSPSVEDPDPEGPVWDCD